jgi:hypothetical protein
MLGFIDPIKDLGPSDFILKATIERECPYTCLRML